MNQFATLKSGEYNTCMTALERNVAGSVTPWLSARFAERWFKDACGQIPPKGAVDWHLRDPLRRQIIFAICFFESWLFEWVRDELLNRSFESVERYFPYADRRSLKEKVPDVMAELHRYQLIPMTFVPGNEGKIWPKFLDLIDIRNGLVHAAASRPYTPADPHVRVPVPRLSELDSYAPDHPIRIVVHLAHRLYDIVGRKPPEWMTIPKQGPEW